jgi:hypothetical protein
MSCIVWVWTTTLAITTEDTDHGLRVLLDGEHVGWVLHEPDDDHVTWYFTISPNLDMPYFLRDSNSCDKAIDGLVQWYFDDVFETPNDNQSQTD